MNIDALAAQRLVRFTCGALAVIVWAGGCALGAGAGGERTGRGKSDGGPNDSIGGDSDGGAACGFDSDLDGVVDCEDGCPADTARAEAGRCGCISDENRADDCTCMEGFLESEDACVSLCGNGFVDPSETCDDANLDNTDGCAACRFAICGDGWVRSGLEGCDGDGSGRAGETTTCNADCTVAACGDGVVNKAAGEACDRGEAPAPATASAMCDADCTLPVCGDGDVSPLAGEFCDDKNSAKGDGCDGCIGEKRYLGPARTAGTADDADVNATTPNYADCEVGSAAIAISGRAGWYLDQVAITCAALDGSLRPTSAEKGTGTVGQSAGGNAFGPLRCPAGQLLVGATVEHNDHFRSIQGRCHEPAWVAAGFDNSGQTTIKTEKYDTGFGPEGRLLNDLTCPNGNVMTGFSGYPSLGEQTTSAVTLICRPMQALL